MRDEQSTIDGLLQKCTVYKMERLELLKAVKDVCDLLYEKSELDGKIVLIQTIKRLCDLLLDKFVEQVEALPVIESGFKPARYIQAERNKGESMKALADSNVSVDITEIKDKDGNLLVRFTREYGVAIPSAEVIAIESALLELAAKLQAAL